MLRSCRGGKTWVRLFWRATLLSFPFILTTIVWYYCMDVWLSVMVCLEDCIRKSMWGKLSVFGVVWNRGWRAEVMEIFAFCQPLTFISKPSFAFYSSSSLNVTVAPCLPFACGHSGEMDWALNSDHLLGFWFKAAYTVSVYLSVCVNVHTCISVCTWIGSVWGFPCTHTCVCVCVVRANLTATQCHGAIIPALAQWPRLNPGFDPPPNLSLQSLGWGWVLYSACQLDSACFFPSSLVCLLPRCPPTEELAIEISFRVA